MEETDDNKGPTRKRVRREVIRELCGLAPYERRLMELIRNSRDKRAKKFAKKRVRGHGRGILILDIVRLTNERTMRSWELASEERKRSKSCRLLSRHSVVRSNIRTCPRIAAPSHLDNHPLATRLRQQTHTCLLLEFIML